MSELLVGACEKHVLVTVVTIQRRDTWLSLATNHPKSKYAAEAWLRVGEHHFEYGEWKLAEKAYSAASGYKDSMFFDMVL